MRDVASEEAATPLPARPIGAPWWVVTALGIVLLAVGISNLVMATHSPLSDLKQTVAYACGYNAGAEMVLGHAVGPPLEGCAKIKATAAANGFNQP